MLHKVATIQFLEVALKCVEIGQKWYPCDHPVKNNVPKFRKYFFTGVFFVE